VLELSSWPTGMRVIVRAERPHPGAQLRFTDIDGNRLTAFVTNTSNGQLADLELRHRRRARCEDRIRGAKDTGLINLPLKDFAQNQIWIAVVALATELTAWMQTLALTGTDARRWEPNDYGCGCSQWPGPSPADPAASGCTCPRGHRTGICSRPAWPDSHCCPIQPDLHQVPPTSSRKTPPERGIRHHPGDHRAPCPTLDPDTRPDTADLSQGGKVGHLTKD